MKLISMTSFVLEIEKSSYTQTEKYRIIEWENKCQAFDKIINYAKFLKQPLKLEMFAHCDEEDKVLFEEIPISQAKWLVKSFSTIESLSDISNTITPIYLNNNAIKQIGL